jgi:CRISPR-associated exonuclease Cas4
VHTPDIHRRRTFKWSDGTTVAVSRDHVAFSDLARAAYCPRQLYYARRDDDRGVPAAARERMALAFRYPDLRRCDDAALAAEPVALPPVTYRRALDRLAGRDDWTALVDPARRHVTLAGRDCRGVAHKVLDGGGGGSEDGAPTADEGGGDAAPPTPVLVSPGDPPDTGVWAPQRVRAVAAATALAWEREREIPRALVEYPAHAAVRTVRLTAGNRAAYRRTLRTVRSLDGPPPRTDDRAKCEACDYRTECGAPTRSLRSLLGL